MDLAISNPPERAIPKDLPNELPVHLRNTQPTGFAYLPSVEKVEAARALAVEGWVSTRKENQCSLRAIAGMVDRQR